jgi:hypothetical protein
MIATSANITKIEKRKEKLGTTNPPQLGSQREKEN